MTKQLLIYDQVEPVSKEKHATSSIKVGKDYSFAKNTNAIPLMAIELPDASLSYPVVFTGKDDEVMPMAVMGVREGENLYINKKGEMNGKYIPAFLRRYPFVFSRAGDGSNFILCIDDSFSGCNNEGRGERLFDADGEETQYLKSVLEFQKDYQSQFYRTQAFCKNLVRLELMEPMEMQILSPQGEKMTLSGFLAINRKKLKELPGEELEKLAKTDELELIYIHMQSMKNFHLLKERMWTTISEDGKSADQKVSERKQK